VDLTGERFFLDTSCIDRIYRKSHPQAKEIYFDTAKRKYSSNYMLKEAYRLFVRKGWSQQEISLALDEIRRKCVIIDIGPDKASAIEISDKSDAPIVAGAKAVDATLVTADRKLAKEASAYVKVLLLGP